METRPKRVHDPSGGYHYTLYGVDPCPRCGEKLKDMTWALTEGVVYPGQPNRCTQALWCEGCGHWVYLDEPDHYVIHKPNGDEEGEEA